MNTLDNVSSRIRFIPLQYALIGALFGLCFPFGALFLEFILAKTTFSFGGIWTLHIHNKLLFMIDSAPLFLGLFALIGGINQKKAVKANLLSQELVLKLQENEHKIQYTLTSQQDMLLKNDKLLNVIESNTNALSEEKGIIFSAITQLNECNHVISQHVQTITAQIENADEIFTKIIQDTHIFTSSASETVQMTQSNLTYMSDAIDSTKVSSQLIFQIVNHGQVLNDSTQLIKQALLAIENISKQTRILALNAAIESARNDGGRSSSNNNKGFSAVAKEITALVNVTTDVTTQMNVAISEIERAISFVLNDVHRLNELSVKDMDIFNQLAHSSNAIFKKINDMQQASTSITKIADEEMTTFKNLVALAMTIQSTQIEISKMISTATNQISNEGQIIDSLRNVFH